MKILMGVFLLCLCYITIAEAQWSSPSPYRSREGNSLLAPRDTRPPQPYERPIAERPSWREPVEQPRSYERPSYQSPYETPRQPSQSYPWGKLYE